MEKEFAIYMTIFLKLNRSLMIFALQLLYINIIVGRNISIQSLSREKGEQTPGQPPSPIIHYKIIRTTNSYS